MQDKKMNYQFFYITIRATTPSPAGARLFQPRDPGKDWRGQAK